MEDVENMEDMEMQPPHFESECGNANSNANSNDNDVHAMEPNANADVNANDNDANVMEPNAHAVISDENRGDNATETDELIRNDNNLQLNNAETIDLNLDCPGNSPGAKGQEISGVNCDVFNSTKKSKKNLNFFPKGQII